MLYDNSQNPETLSQIPAEVIEIVGDRMAEIDASLAVTGTTPEVVSGENDRISAEGARAIMNQASTHEVQAATVSTETDTANDNVVPLFKDQTPPADRTGSSDQLDEAQIRARINELNNVSKAA